MARGRRFALVFGGVLVACAAKDDVTIPASDVHVDEVDVVRGVPDDARDPGVVGVEVEGEAPCAAVLLAPDAVLTARHCISHVVPGATCPGVGAQIQGDVAPATINVFVGEAMASAELVAKGRRVVAPEGGALCNQDIAVVLLDRPIDTAKVLFVAEVGVTEGARIRTVAYGTPAVGTPLATKLLREHVLVLDTTFQEFRVAEGGCASTMGGPAFDETTGAIVGVLSRAGPACDGSGAFDVYTRADAFYSLVEEALSLRASLDGAEEADAGAHTVKLPTDVGAACATGDQCAAGACVSENKRAYCSRSCTGADKCPTHFKCEEAEEGPFVCVEH